MVAKLPYETTVAMQASGIVPPWVWDHWPQLALALLLLPIALGTGLVLFAYLAASWAVRGCPKPEKARRGQG